MGCDSTIRAARSFPSMWLRVETALACSSFFRGRWRRPSSATACRSKRSSFRKRDWTGSGFIDCCSPTGLRATSSTRLRSRSTGGIGGQDRCDRRRDAVADADGLGSRRAAGLFHVRAPSREDEDRRRLTRERGTLLKNAFSIPIESGPAQRPRRPGLRSASRDRFEQLEALRTGDGRDLPPMLKEEIRRELDRIALVTTQLAVVERARDALIRMDAEEHNNPAALLLKLKGLGPEFASLLWLNRSFEASATDARWRLTAIGAQSLAERRRRTGPGHLEVGQSPPAQDDD